QYQEAAEVYRSQLLLTGKAAYALQRQGNALGSLGDWTSANRVLIEAVRLFELQLKQAATLEGKMAAISEVKWLFTDTAHSFLQIGNPLMAACNLEDGRAKVLTERLLGNFAVSGSESDFLPPDVISPTFDDQSPDHRYGQHAVNVQGNVESMVDDLV